MSRIVEARFECWEKIQSSNQDPDDQTANVKLRAVTRTREGNEDWSKHTPWGELDMGITNPDACDVFEPGGLYRITIEKL